MKYSIINLCIIEIFLIILCKAQTGLSLCDADWESYNDEKCFKFIDRLVNESDAEIICSQLDSTSTLATIHSNNEQEYLSNLLFKTHKNADPVWIEAMYINKIEWTDKSALDYTNWAKDSINNSPVKSCIEMLPGGKWCNVSCNTFNKVVCQKIQSWSISNFQKIFIEARRHFEEEINNLKHNPIPIGFIYAQLPNQPDPKTLWPSVEWQDITTEYAGLFFRAEGSGSEAFGNLQNENSPRLLTVNSTVHIDIDHANYEVPPNPIKIVAGQISKNIHTGDHKDFPAYSINFEVSGGEVRPRNKAIKIWKRIN